mmetsp:Transcript_23205/g.27901  ORF Transcript_23205/g.27901 Transcript_23205/m.27901 type:complete len:379 (+) Transcript_23205:14-1150(+)
MKKSNIFVLLLGLGLGQECIAFCVNSYPLKIKNKPQAIISTAKKTNSETIQRVGVLLTVPIVWGTYAPCVRLAYNLPSVSALSTIAPNLFSVSFSAAYYFVATTALAFVSTILIPSSQEVDQGVDRAGIELGLYLFLGNCAQVLGLQTTSADAAAFLVQLTTIVVPAIEAFSKPGTLTPRTRNCCLIAFIGVAVICGADIRTTPSAATGDALIVLAAIFYSVHVVRLSSIAVDFRPVDLAFSKAKAEASFSIISVAVFAFPFFYSSPSFSYLPVVENSMKTLFSQDISILLAVVTWCGLFTCGYTIFAQSYGQRGISAASANLIYTSQPIFSAFFAALLLNEQPTPATLLGGLLILSAVVADLQDRLPAQTSSSAYDR